MARTYKSQFDNKTFPTVTELEIYVTEKYKNKIPNKYKGDVSHFLYDKRNKPGVCQICKTPTVWDPKLKKYEILCRPITIKRFLTDPLRVIRTLFKNRGNSCQEVMRKNYLENIQKKYNTDNLMNNIEYQQMLLENRSIAKVVKFKNKEYTVIGTFEEHFVKVLNKMNVSTINFESPGPTIRYEAKDGTKKEHITDFFLSNINTVVSIKDGGKNRNNHPSMLARRESDTYKFKGLIENTKYNLIELNGLEDIDKFPVYYEDIKKYAKNNVRYIKYPEYYNDYIL